MKTNIIEKIACVLLGVALAIPTYSYVYEARRIKDIEEHEEPVVLTATDLPVVTIVEPEPETIRDYLGIFKITAYCSCVKCCEQWADGITYTGTVATEGRTIAVDPDVIPLGSVVEINGNEYIAEDIGGVIDGNRIDLFFDSHEDALEWGVQNLDVYLVHE